MTPEGSKTMSSTAVSTPAATRTILIVDDDPSVTETFERMLRLEGYHVVTALSAEAGLNLLVDRLKTFRNNDEFLAEIAKQPSM